MVTKIEWVTNPDGTKGETWNPVTGCTKISSGCAHCYAERMSKRLAGRFGYSKEEPFRVTLHYDKLLQPFKWKKPRRIFICSMGDLFHENLTFGEIARVMRVIEDTPQHIYQILTKRPRRMREYCETFGRPRGRSIPSNIWWGISVENQTWADKRREDFKRVSTSLKFVSYEPALGEVDWRGWEFVSQIIFGGESGHGKRPVNLDWAYKTLEFCRNNHIAFFMKQVDKVQSIPKDLMVREYPWDK